MTILNYLTVLLIFVVSTVSILGAGSLAFFELRGFFIPDAYHPGNWFRWTVFTGYLLMTGVIFLIFGFKTDADRFP